MDLLDIVNIIYLSILRESVENIIEDEILKILKIINNIKTLGFNGIINIILKLLLLNLLLMYL